MLTREKLHGSQNLTLKKARLYTLLLYINTGKSKYFRTRNGFVYK